MPSLEAAGPAWTPDPAAAADSRMADFARSAAERFGLDLEPTDYPALLAWSTEHPVEFWSHVWKFFDVIAHQPYHTVLADPTMPGRGWFAGAEVNYAENALRWGADDAIAIVSADENGGHTAMTWGELRTSVGNLSHWLRERGVGIGDCVVGYLPNGAPAIVAFLAAASVGAIWSCCATDYGVEGALSRFAQLEPVVLFAATGTTWKGKRIDRRGHVADLRAGLSTLHSTVTVDDTDTGPEPGVTRWADAVAGDHTYRADPVPASSPLWVLFSSGTTGVPKGIVHSHAGVLVEHFKQLGLHFDLRPGNRLFWHTSTNWMVWNLQVSALLVGATIITYDGNPAIRGPDTLWRLAAEHRATVFGTSPGYLVASAKAEVAPARDHDLSALKILGVTGSPMPAASYDWVYDHLDPRVQVSCGAGGTDVVSAFASGNPLMSVWPGEIPAPALGVALAAWDDLGAPVVGQVGELVIISPMPTMPLYFWEDPGGERYEEAYFSTYPGVWRHGDWVLRTHRGGVVFAGRSDSTLNRNGIRLGSADIYAALDGIPELRDALVVGAELGDGGYWMPLFVELDRDVTLNDALRDRIRSTIATHASPRHVPDDVIAVPGLPHTRTGKRLEVPVKRILQGADPSAVVNRDAVDHAEFLDQFQALARARAGQG